MAGRSGNLFLSQPKAPSGPSRVECLGLPAVTGGGAIWGATGRDVRGHLWIGVSQDGGEHSARLLELDPARGVPSERGDALSALVRAGLGKPGQRQAKIHSKIALGSDGALYFASMDEYGEREDGSRLPDWGGNLWRYRVGGKGWDHLLQTREALIAVCSSRRWIYALGYWGHVLYQYDVGTGALRSKVLGSLGGHVSRNLVCSGDGRVYVPRLNAGNPSEGSPGNASLVELGPDLEEIGSTVIARYFTGDATSPEASHGITGIAYLANGSIVIATHPGYLYLINPSGPSSARVEALGPLHPRGEAYAPSLFTYDGERFLGGVTRRDGRYEWVVYDLDRRLSRAYPLALPAGLGDLLLYGSVTRDERGAFYVVGRYQPSREVAPQPILLALTP